MSNQKLVKSYSLTNLYPIVMIYLKNRLCDVFCAMYMPLNGWKSSATAVGWFFFLKNVWNSCKCRRVLKILLEILIHLAIRAQATLRVKEGLIALDPHLGRIFCSLWSISLTKCPIALIPNSNARVEKCCFAPESMFNLQFSLLQIEAKIPIVIFILSIPMLNCCSLISS